jgi:hypothetical protein
LPSEVIDCDRLARAVQQAHNSLEGFRVPRHEAIQHFAGNNWRDDVGDRAVPLNLISLYVQIILRSLVAKEPRVLLSTDSKAALPLIEPEQSWTNREIKRQNLGVVLEEWVQDALFGIGILKVALADPGESARMSWNLESGKPFMMRIDPDDFVYGEIGTRTFDEVTFIGHRRRVPWPAFKEGGYRKKDIERLEPSTKNRSRFNVAGDEKLEALQEGDQAWPETFIDYVDVWELYIPSLKKVVEIADEDVVTGGCEYALSEKDWLGPDCGPYHVIGFMKIPNQAWPKGPIADLVDLHVLANNIYRKLSREAENKKTVGAAESTEDAEAATNASDMQIIKMSRPDSIKTISFNGPDPGLIAFLSDVVNRFSYMAGGLELMGGLSPQAKTATQDKMLEENASKGLAAMQATVQRAFSKALTSMCWYWHHNPFIDMNVSLPVPGMADMQIPVSARADDRAKVSWEEMDVQVDPYSYQHSTPQSRAAALDNVVMQILTPLMPLLQQAGYVFDPGAYLQKRSKLTDMPDLPEIISIGEPPAQDTAPSGGDSPHMPAKTERTYTRRSLGGQSAQAKDASLLAAAQGRSSKDAETNGMVFQ